MRGELPVRHEADTATTTTDQTTQQPKDYVDAKDCHNYPADDVDDANHDAARRCR